MTQPIESYDELKIAFLKARGWNVDYGLSHRNKWVWILSDSSNDEWIDHDTEAEAWASVAVTLETLFGKGGALDEATKAGWEFDIQETCVVATFKGRWREELCVPGPPSEALPRAIMQATVWMKEEQS